MKTQTIKILIGIWKHLSTRRKIQLFIMLCVMVLSGICELISIASVLPFLAAISNPQIILDNKLAINLLSFFELSEPNQILLPFTVIFVVSVLVATSIKLLNLFLYGKLAESIGADFSRDAFRNVLYQNYSEHLLQNSSEIINTITIQLDQTIQVLNFSLQILSALVSVIAIVFVLIVIEPIVTLVALSIFLVAYIFIAISVKKRLSINGYRSRLASSSQFKILQESLGSIRDVILDRSQPTILKLYSMVDRPRRYINAESQFLGSCPRYILEAMGICLIIIFAWKSSSNISLPLIGTLVLASQKLLPSLQQIYGGWACISSRREAVKTILKILNQPRITKCLPLLPKDSLSFIDLKFEGISYSYTGIKKKVISNASFYIRSGERIGLIGKTGEGKSTIIDLLLGLLIPTSGKILVNQSDLHNPVNPKLLPIWQNALSHVPQSIYLIDASIASNIALGVPENQINHKLIKQVSDLAQITTFVKKLPDKWMTNVGERGVRLSGGQRQRIGIARALYKNPKILVLDEATSALDIQTESAVMESIKNISRDITIFIVTHRLSTLKLCDRIYEVKNSKVSHTTYDNIIN